MGRKIFIGLLALIGLFVIAFGVSEFKMKGQLDDIDRTPVDMTRCLTECMKATARQNL